MNNLRILSYITIMLILFQSFSAVASSLDFHAIDTQHLQQEHDHALDDTFVLNESLADAEDAASGHHNPADCHHCGHCHGTHVQWVGLHVFQHVELAKQVHHFYYLNTVIDAPVSQLLRPPKVLVV